MGESQLDKRYSNFIIVLLLLFPVFINSVKVLGNLILLIITILGIYIAISEKKNPFQIPELKLFSWLTIGYFLVMLLSIIIADGFNANLNHLGRIIHFLLAPFIALALLQIDLPFKNLLLSIKLGLMVVLKMFSYWTFYIFYCCNYTKGLCNDNVAVNLVSEQTCLNPNIQWPEQRAGRTFEVPQPRNHVLPVSEMHPTGSNR